MSRLTNSNKEEIAKLIVKDHFKEVDAALYARRCALMEEFAGIVSSPEILALAKKQKKHYLYFYEAYDYHIWHSDKGRIFFGYYYRDLKKKTFWLPANLSKSSNPYGTDEFKNKLLDFQHDTEEQESKYHELMGKVQAKLSEFSTVKKLMLEWPEIESYVKQVVNIAGGTSLSVNVFALNQELGLPKE